MLERTGAKLSHLCERYLPDPFVFAIILTFFTLGLGCIFTDNHVFQMIEYWNQGFLSLLAFAMQMCLILVTGYALALTAPIQKSIGLLSKNSSKYSPGS